MVIKNFFSPELCLYLSINSCLVYAIYNHKIVQVSEIILSDFYTAMFQYNRDLFV